MDIVSEVSAFLTVKDGSGTRRVSLSGRQKWSLGRKTPANDPDIALASPIVSRSHGEFVCMNGQWFYFYRGSMNPTYYNGKKLHSGLNGRVTPVLLLPGAVLCIDCEDPALHSSNRVELIFSDR